MNRRDKNSMFMKTKVARAFGHRIARTGQLFSESVLARLGYAVGVSNKPD